MRMASVVSAVRAMLAAGQAVSTGAVSAMVERENQTSPRYPEWQSTRKTRGRRDASQRERSNRRKASARRRG